MMNGRAMTVFFFVSVITVTLFFVTLPFFHDGFFPTMDDVQVVRIDEMSRELESGQFPVRYVNNLGNGGGYMLFHFYAPFVYYLGALYHMLGFPLVAATKLVFLTGYFIGAMGIIVLLKRYTDWIVTTIGTILFLTSTYLAYDVYTRGALAEFFALCLLPWLFWSFLRQKESVFLQTEQSKVEKHVVASSPNRRTINIISAGFFYGLLIITHNITSFTVSIFLVLMLFLPPFTKRIFVHFVLAGLIGLGFSAFFWLPVVFEQSNTVLGSVDFVTKQYKSNFLNPLQVGAVQKIPWGFTPPLLGLGLFIGLGLAILFLVIRHCEARSNLIYLHSILRALRLPRILRTFTLSMSNVLTTTYKGAYLFTVTGSLLSLLLIWQISKPLWDILPYMRFMQFPWRYLSITTVLAVLVIALFLSKIRYTWLKIALGVLLIIPAFTIHRPYLRPTTYNYIAHYYAEDSCRTTTWAQEQLPIWVKECLPKNNTLPIVLTYMPGMVTTNIVEAKNGREITFLSQGLGGFITLKRYYYPAWQATVDQIPARIVPFTSSGLVRLYIPPGEHTVHVQFTSLPLWKFANIISVITWVFLVLMLLYNFLRLSTRLVPYVYNKKGTRL